MAKSTQKSLFYLVGKRVSREHPNQNRLTLVPAKQFNEHSRANFSWTGPYYLESGVKPEDVILLSHEDGAAMGTNGWATFPKNS